MTSRQSALAVPSRASGAPWRALPLGIARYGLALAGVALMSLLIDLVLATGLVRSISILYLIVILAAATTLGRGPAIVASVAAFLTYDFFFTEPYHELTVSDPQEWLSLTLFLIAAIITGQLAARERLRAEQAQRREREAVLLFDALRLLTDPDLHAALRDIVDKLPLTPIGKVDKKALCAPYWAGSECQVH